MVKTYMNFIKSAVVISIIFVSVVFSQNQMGRNNPGAPSNGKITGKLIDAQTNQIIEYGNVVLFGVKDSSMVNGTITDKDGRFKLENLPFGQYYIKVSYIGYATKYIDSIRINPRSAEVDLGTIYLDEQSIELGNVLVTGQKEMVINNLDKKVINVDKDLTSTGGSAVDVVGNIPSVTVDLDGNVSYRGNQNITILIDGKPSTLVGASNSDILNSIPATQIESIELVTNPSARYDPDGTSGILNIILKKRIDGGLNGSISVNVGTKDKYNTSLNLNYRTPYFNFFGSYDNRLSRSRNEGNSLRTNNINNNFSYLSTLSNGMFKFGSHNVSAGFDYLYDDFSTFTFTYRFRDFGFGSDSKISNSNLDNLNQLSSYFERYSGADRDMNGNSYSFSYRRTFEQKGAELTADVILGKNSMSREENITQKNYDLNLDPLNENLQQGVSSNSNTRWTIQSNYVNPIEGFGRIETGFKINLQELNSKNDYLDFNAGSGSWINNPTRKTDFNYKEKIYAVYGIYSNNYDKFQYQIGLRAEQANVDGSELNTSTFFNKKYFAVYPTIHFVQGLPYDMEAQLSYSRRVQRPWNNMLNPYVDRSDSLNIQYGNPDLNPEYVNSFDVGYSKFFGKIVLTSSFFYKYTNDVITSFTILRDDGVTETTWRNLAKSSSYGIELTTSLPLVDWLRINGSFSYFNTKYDGLNISTNDNSWISKLNTTFMLSKDFNFQINTNYNSPILTAQRKVNSMFSTDLAVKKDFLDGQLSVTFRVSDIFNTRKMDSETFGTNFFTSSYRKMESRVAYLGISYRLSPATEIKKKTEKNEVLKTIQ
ncbi:MAG TPA: TonB-dependent receptor [Ignavibacteriaceae bacterium]|nr:TonB-dependent receptor [Ignavibacteriaceae bacterium]